MVYTYADHKQLHAEKNYHTKWCALEGGQTSVVLSDGIRCECLTATHAIEFDFANKWVEGIGHALHHANLTGRHADLVLIIAYTKDTSALSAS